MENRKIILSLNDNSDFLKYNYKKPWTIVSKKENATVFELYKVYNTKEENTFNLVHSLFQGSLKDSKLKIGNIIIGPIGTFHKDYNFQLIKVDKYKCRYKFKYLLTNEYIFYDKENIALYLSEEPYDFYINYVKK